MDIHDPALRRLQRDDRSDSALRESPRRMAGLDREHIRIVDWRHTCTMGQNTSSQIHRLAQIRGQQMGDRCFNNSYSLELQSKTPISNESA